MEKLYFNGTKCHLTSHSQPPLNKTCWWYYHPWLNSTFLSLHLQNPNPSHRHFPSLFPIQKYSPAALRPLQAPHQDLSPRCQKSASPHRWGCVRWGRFPCPKTRATNRPCRSRRGRICHTHPTPRESGAVKFLPPTFSAVRKSIVIHNTLQAASQTNNCLNSEEARVKSAVKNK